MEGVCACLACMLGTAQTLQQQVKAEELDPQAHQPVQSKDSFHMALPCSHMHGSGRHRILDGGAAPQVCQRLYHAHLRNQRFSYEAASTDQASKV